jgi:hypothetical protein
MYRSQYLRLNKNMHNIKQQLKLAFGAFAIIVSVSASAELRVMPTIDLDHFQIDCRIKEQQIRFLQSMRVNADERINANLLNIGLLWQRFTNPAQFQQRADIGSGYSNWAINQLLVRLAHDCP